MAHPFVHKPTKTGIKADPHQIKPWRSRLDVLDLWNVFGESGDAEPNIEHLIAYGPPFRPQTRENRDTGRPPQNQALALKAPFFRFLGPSGGFQKT